MLAAYALVPIRKAKCLRLGQERRPRSGTALLLKGTYEDRHSIYEAQGHPGILRRHLAVLTNRPGSTRSLSAVACNARLRRLLQRHPADIQWVMGVFVP